MDKGCVRDGVLPATTHNEGVDALEVHKSGIRDGGLGVASWEQLDMTRVWMPLRCTKAASVNVSCPHSFMWRV